MGFLKDLFKPVAGLGVTFRHLFREKVTVQYPETKKQKPQRYHGRHVLNRYPDGMEKCIGCELCAGVCPARCIYVRGAENPPHDPVSPGERYGFVYEINMLRCIFCALCVEACPTEAITMTHLFEFSVTNRQDAVYTRDELLMDEEGDVPHPQSGPLVDLDELRDADGWMRATAPSGRAAYEGVVAWTPTAGAGLRPPERGQSEEPREDAEVEHPGEAEGEVPEPAEPQDVASSFEQPPVRDDGDRAERGRGGSGGHGGPRPPGGSEAPDAAAGPPEKEDGDR